MIVVSDTSAITSLIQVGRETVLPGLFERVIIPPAVRDELLIFHAIIPSFLEVAAVGNAEKVGNLLEDLDKGEAEAIVLAEATRPDYLLIDDLAARTIAIRKGLPVIGLLGVLIKAKRNGLVGSLESVIVDLETKAGFRISSELRNQVLAAGGE